MCNQSREKLIMDFGIFLKFFFYYSWGSWMKGIEAIVKGVI